MESIITLHPVLLYLCLLAFLAVLTVVQTAIMKKFLKVRPDVWREAWRGYIRLSIFVTIGFWLGQLPKLFM